MKLGKKMMAAIVAFALFATSLLPGAEAYAEESEKASKTYEVKLVPVEHGAVITDKKEYAAKEKVKVTVQPDQGYKLAELQVADQEKKSLVLAEEQEGISFLMPESSVTVTAKMDKQPETEKEFETQRQSETQIISGQQKQPESKKEEDKQKQSELQKDTNKQKQPEPRKESGAQKQSEKQKQLSTQKQEEAVKQLKAAAVQPETAEKGSRSAADDVDYEAIKGEEAVGLFNGATKISGGLNISADYTGFMRKTSGLAPTLSFTYDSTYQTADKTYPSITLKSAYKTNGLSATYPKSCFYGGTWVDIKVTAIDWKKDGGDNVNMFFTGERPGVMVDNCKWIELKYEFFKTGTNTPVRVKGYSTWKDIDFDQGIVLKDGFLRTKAGVFAVPAAKNKLAYASVNGNPYYFDDHNSTATDDMPEHMITALYDGSMLKAVYTFVRHNVSTIGKGAITNESDKLLPGPVSIQKRISDNDEKMVIEDTLNQSPEPRKEHFTYTLTATTAGETPSTYYSSYQIQDQIDVGLLINTSGITITDENGVNVKGWFDIAESSNNLTINAKAAMLQNSSFYAKVFQINIPVSIKDTTDLRADRYWDKTKEMAKILNASSLKSSAGNVSSNMVTTWVPLIVVPERGGLTITKTEDGTGTPLSGVTFNVYQWNGSAYSTVVYDTLTDARVTGTYRNSRPYTFTSTNQGKFKVVETQSAVDHFNSGWSQEIAYDGTAAKELTYSVTNPKMEPKIAVTKLADRTSVSESGEKTPGWYQYSNTILYTMVAKNTGNVAVKNMIVTDTMSKELKKAVNVESAAFQVEATAVTANGKTVNFTKNSGTQVTLDNLEAGDSVPLTFAVTVGYRDQVKGLESLINLDNVVKVTASYFNSHQDAAVPEDEDDTDNDKINVYNPLISITKLADCTTVTGEGTKTPGWYDFEKTITYTMEAKNYGNVPVNNLIVEDTLSKELGDVVLADKAGFVIGDTATTENGNVIKLVKDPKNGKKLTMDTLSPGDRITLTFTAKVRPRAELKDFDLVKLEKLNNHVKITGEFDTNDSEPAPVPEDEDDQDEDEINVYNPLISITKLADRTTVTGEGRKTPGWYDFEETVTYTMEVRNYGNTVVNNMVIEDILSKELGDVVFADEAGFVLEDPDHTDTIARKTEKGNPIHITKDPANAKKLTLDTLASGDSVTLTFQAKVRPKEEWKDLGAVRLEKLKNQVKITGEYDNMDPDPQPVPPDEDDEGEDEINVYNPLMSVTKTANKTTISETKEKVPGWYHYNELISYDIVISNYGNVDISDLHVKDAMSDELKAAVLAEKAAFLVSGEETTQKGKTIKITRSSNLEIVLDRLEAGDSVTVKFMATVNDRRQIKDLAALEGLNNHVKITGTFEKEGSREAVPEDADDQDDDKVNIYNPLMRVTKKADRTKGKTGGTKIPGAYTFSDAITYHIRVENYGNTAIRNLKVEDTMGKELKALIQKRKAAFMVSKTARTKRGNLVKVTKNSSLAVTLNSLEAGDSVSLKVQAVILDAGAVKEEKELKNLKNMVHITGTYGDNVPVTEDEDDTDMDAIDILAGWVELFKTSAKDNKALLGAVFEVYDAKGEVAATLTTDSKGYAKSDRLAAGSYYAVEKTSPKGYKLDTGKKRFTVRDGKIATLNVKNDLDGTISDSGSLSRTSKTTTPAKTGDKTDTILYVCIAGLALVAFLLGIKKKKK